MSAEETTKNFWDVWRNFQWPEIKPACYRLYYHEDGSPNIYTMEDLPGAWIEVSQQIYVTAPENVRVVAGELQIIPLVKTHHKLQPSDSGTACDPRDVCVIADDTGPRTYWNLTTYEIS
jgi:hypothetical protein